jgi:vitamin B12 transporter
MKKRSQVVLLLLLVFSATQAEPDPKTLEMMIVTATRLDTPVSELTPSVEIITRDQIDRRHPSSATELLRQVAGMNIIQQGGRGGVSSILLRGGEPNFTVVLFDGVRVNDPTNTRGGSYDFTNLGLGGIGRIEVVRGPMSALYGSDALAGVINIIKRDDLRGGEAVFETGSAGYVSVNVSLGGRLGRSNAGLEIHTLSETGDVEGAAYKGWGLTGNLKSQISEQIEVGLALRLQNSESTSYPEDSGGPRLAVFQNSDERESEEAHLNVTLNNELSDGWLFSVAGSHYRRAENATSPGIAPGVFNGVPPNSADTIFTRDQFVTSIRTDLDAGLSILVGVEWQKEKGESIGFLDFDFPLPTNFKLDRNTYSAFSEISIHRGPIVLQGGLRWDDPDEIHGEATARVGGFYKFSNDLTEIRANWGQGFKAPSFFSIGHPLVGNPDLEVETATSVDITVNHRLNGLKGEFGISIFRNGYNNLIDFDPELFLTVNRSHVVTQGAEVTMAWAPNEGLGFHGHVTYLKSDIRNSPVELRGRPEWRGGAVVDWKINDKWYLATSVLVLDEFYESSIPTGGQILDGYIRLDTALTYQPRENVAIHLAADNLFDEGYEEAVGFPAAGIGGRLGLKFSF